jgi:hypothetical protein
MLEQISCDSLEEAERLVKQFKKILHNHHVLLVADVYDFVDIYTKAGDNMRGWQELDKLKIIQNGNKYVLDFPDPKILSFNILENF